MLKIARTGSSFHIFDTTNGSFFSINQTSWELIKAVKKHGRDRAVSKIAKLYSISEERAKKDINYIIKQITSSELNVDDIPLTVPKTKYAPRSVEFDITSKCNSRCIYCLASNRMKDPTELSTQKIIDVIHELNDIGTWSITLSGGEPTLRPDLFDILEHIEKLELGMSVFTNGINIDEQMAKKFSKFKHIFVQISLDSSNPVHHDQQRGVNGAFEKTLQGIKNLLKYNIFVEIATIVTPLNVGDIDDLVSFLHDLNIKSIRISPVSLLGRACDDKQKMILSSGQLKKLGEKIAKLNKKYEGSMIISKSPHMVTFSGNASSNEPLSRCGAGKNNLYISPNGLVYPCMLLAFPEFVLGDIKKERVSDIWKKSPKIRKFRYLTTDKFRKCGTCKFKNLCNGGCRGTAYIATKSLTEPDPVFSSYFGCQ